MTSFAIKITNMPDYRQLMSKMKKLGYEEDHYWNEMIIQEGIPKTLYLTKGEGESFLSLFKFNTEEDNTFDSYEEFKKAYDGNN